LRIDIIEPLPRPTMDDLGEIANRRLSHLQQLLPLQMIQNLLVSLM
jgi:hypothetical protein